MVDLKVLKLSAKHVAHEYGLNLVVLFGSQARGKTHPQSDVDIGVLADHRLEIMELARLQLSFSETFKIKNVEVVNLKSAPPLLLKEVADDGIPLYENNPLIFDELRLYAFKRYREAKPLLNLRFARLNRFLQKA